MKKKEIALLLNICLFLIESYTITTILLKNHSFAIQYYTNDSNLLALITSFLFIIYFKKEKKWINDLRFITTCCLTITFLVVLFILTPMYNFNYKFLMFTKEMFIFHTLCPIISFISYTFYEKKSSKSHLGLLTTAIYALILISLNILKVIEGPYPFLKVYKQSIISSIIWFIIIIGGSYLVGIGINKINSNNKKGAKK